MLQGMLKVVLKFVIGFCLTVVLVKAQGEFYTFDFGGDESGRVIPLNSGNIAVMGYSSQGSNEDLLFAEFDASYSYIGGLSYGVASNDERLYDMLEMDNGDLILTGRRLLGSPLLMSKVGSTINAFGFNSGTFQDRMKWMKKTKGNTLIQLGEYQGLIGLLNTVTLIKYDANLNPIWNNYYDHSQTMNNEGERYIYDIHERDDSSIVGLGAYSWASNGTKFQNVRARLFEIDSLGVMQKVIALDTLGLFTRPMAFCPTDSGGYLVAGYTKTGPALNYQASFSASEDMFIYKLDSQLNVVWAKQGLITGNDRILKIISIGNDEYLMAGNVNSVGSFTGQNAFLSKINGDGKVIWAKSYGGNGDDEVDNLMIENGTVFLSGSTNSFSSPTTKDVFLVKTDTSGIVNDTCYDDIASFFVFQDRIKTSSQLPVYPTVSCPLFNNLNIVAGSLTGTSQEQCPLCVTSFSGQGIDVCLNDSTYFSSSQAPWLDSIHWSFGDGQYLVGNTNPSHLYSSSGIYSVNVYASNDSLNCEDSATFDVQVFALPEPDAGEDTCVCMGENLTIGKSLESSWTYFWNPTGSTLAQPEVQPSQTTTYIVNVLDQNGCTGVDSLEVCVYLLPDIQAASDTTIMFGGQADLIVSGGLNYNWSSEDNIDCPDCPQISVSPDSSTVYYVRGLDLNGCEGFDTVMVSVEFEDAILIPNLFSPNSDGNNDILYVRTFGRIKDLHFRLYNRWGKLVFESKDPDFGWDGYYNGEIQAVDAYVYHLIANTEDGEVIEQKGDVTLMR